MRTLMKVTAAAALSLAAATSHANPLFADTNGDGVIDTITKGSSSSGPYVKIDHPNTGASTYYNFGSGLSYFELVGTTDTDGVAGQEVVVRTGASSGPSISVIDDRAGWRRQYDFGVALSSFAIVSLSVNTDGRAGNEIPVYLYGSNSPAIRIIDDARRTTRQYDFGVGLSYFEITKLTDTNGQGGVEIVTRLDTNATTRSIRIIDDTAQTYRQYSASGQNFAVLGIRNYDITAGDELCYYVTGAYRMIVDRTGGIVPRSNCN
jgi:hypothetical protein